MSEEVITHIERAIESLKSEQEKDFRDIDSLVCLGFLYVAKAFSLELSNKKARTCKPGLEGKTTQ